MVKHIKLTSADDLKKFMQLAWNCASDVGVHTEDDKIADAKSVLGLMALDYAKPVMVVSEDESFFEQIKPWIVEVGS